MNNLQPREEILNSIKKRVMESIADSVHRAAPVLSPIQPPFLAQLFSRGSIASVSMAFALFLVLANQLPLHSTYHESIASIATSQQFTEALKSSPDPVQAAHAVKVATAHARATLDTLKLHGQFGMYSQSDCLHAYIIYDSYLDSLNNYLQVEIPKTPDSTIQMALQDLQVYITDSQAEAQQRLNMYPSRK